jgi:hypothetical protein
LPQRIQEVKGGVWRLGSGFVDYKNIFACYVS